MDYNEWLFNLYVLELAPITSQEWFHSIVGAVTGVVGFAGMLTVIQGFLSDSFLVGLSGYVKTFYDSYILTWLAPACVNTINFFKGVEYLVFIGNFLDGAYVAYTYTVDSFFSYFISKQ